MFKFFKRNPRPASPASEPASRPRTPRSGQDTAPAPLPEVIEGDSESDWDLWQESVNHLDSQLPALPEFKNTEPQDIDIYAKVRKTDK